MHKILILAKYQISIMPIVSNLVDSQFKKLKQLKFAALIYDYNSIEVLYNSYK